MINNYYWIDTKWACGLIVTNGFGIVISGAPIFRRLKGADLNELRKYYKVEFIDKKGEI